MSSRTSGPVYDDSTAGAVALGTTAFAGIMLVTVGFFQILEGIAALADDTVFVSGVDYTYELDVTTWGWVHLIVGILGLVVGAGLMAAQSWALVTGIMVAALGTLTNFAFMPYYPFWSVAVLAFNILVIWALSRQLGPAS